MDQRQPINLLSLCTGGAGFDLALKLVLPSSRTVCMVEREAFAISYLVEAMAKGGLDYAPIWSNVKSFRGKPWRGVVDILLAGYPCQPFSHAGLRRGKTDPRHLWPHVHRIIGEVKPPLVFLENVPGHITLGFNEVAGGLERMGYSVAAGLFAASELGIPQERERLFILAMDHAESQRRQGSGAGGKQESRLSDGKDVATLGSGKKLGKEVGGSDRRYLESGSSARLEGKERLADRCRELGLPALFPPGPEEDWSEILQDADGFAPAQPKVRLLADGMAHYNYLLRLAGNGVIPVVGAYAFVSLYAALTRN